MTKKDDPMTPRQRQSQRIMREKAWRKKRRAITRKLAFIGVSALAIALLGGSVWGWKSGAVARTAQAVVDGTYALTARAGFTVHDIYLEGRGRTSMEEINKALGVTNGDPILKLPLDEMRARLETIESIRAAAVERALPGTLYVRIVEREPVALWQHQGKMALVDDNGVIMTDIDSKPYQHLPLIVGDDAPQHVGELMVLLSSQPELAKRFTAAVRVGERRWNIRLASGVEIKLPENDMLSAWKTLADLETRQQLLDRSVKVVDLRVPGRLFITVTPQNIPAKAKNAKET